MYASIALLALAAGTSASASNAAINYAAIPTANRVILPRQTGSDELLACASAGAALLASLPTPPPAIAKEAVKQAKTVTDPCDYSVPDSLSKDFSSYTKTFMEWMSEHVDDISSLEAECPSASGKVDMLATCSTAVPPKPTGAATEKQTDGKDGDSKDDDSKDGDKKSDGDSKSRASHVADMSLAAAVVAAVFAVAAL